MATATGTRPDSSISTSSHRVRRALAGLALVAAVATPAAIITSTTAAGAQAGGCDDWGCGTNHNETAARDDV